MRYMLLIYNQQKSGQPMPPEEQERGIASARALIAEARELGIFRGADPLEPASTATTVRMHGVKPLITDGPFAETKEQLAGYFILDCKDLDEALEWAARIPICGEGGGCVEVRPIREFNLPAA